ncbi:MAG TPA: hypothetical protein VFS39_11145 [Nitrospira sp.]|nr:hypothetical protein [Nitrospira sp.]
MRRSFVIGFLLFVTACTSGRGLNPATLADVLQRDAASFDGQAAPAGDAPPRTESRPPALGLYIRPAGSLHGLFDWHDRDQDQVMAWANELATRGVVKGITALAPSSLKGITLTEVRKAAARYGATLLLVLDGAADVDRYNNYKAGLFYWTILGAYLAHGTHSDALCVVTATGWDVATGAKLFSESAEGTSRRVGPAALVDDRDEAEQAKRAALDHLLVKLERRLARP